MSTDSQPAQTKPSGSVQADLKQLGKYQIVRRIGAGGMGTVYLAQDPLLKRTVALKVLPKDRAENPILVRRFQSEARASAMLEHENIVSVFDADQADGYLYIALEYIDGIDLSEWLRKRKTIPVKRSIDIIKQVAAALQHAHEKKLVHRDVKPANIMITSKGLVKLADLGLARSIDESLDTTITRDGTTVGTVDYMSPEQAGNSKNTDIRSDLYSLGCTWYHMLTGSPPYPEGGMTNKLAAHAKNSLPDPRDVNPDVSEALVAIIHRLMAKKREDRYQTPAELLEDLNHSSHLESNSAQLLATLLDEEDQESRDAEDLIRGDDSDLGSVLDDDSADFEVQTESQSTLLRKSKVRSDPENNHDSSPAEPLPGQLQPTRKPLSRLTKPERTPTLDDKTETPEPEQPPPKTPARSPLKRIQSAEELYESRPTNDSPDEKNESSELPVKKSQTPSKKKDRAARKQKSRHQKKSSKTSPNKQPAHSQQASKLKIETARTEGNIDIDWGRAGMVLLVLALLLGGIWWGYQYLSRSDKPSEENSYGESNPALDSRTANDPEREQLPNDHSQSGGQGSTGTVVMQPGVDPAEVQFAPPVWMNSDWIMGAKMSGEETFKVQRGKTSKNSFRSLEAALAAAQTGSALIDLSELTQQDLQPVDLQLSGRVTIQGGKSAPILTFSNVAEKSTAPPVPWLHVTGGTLVLRGIHFVVTNWNSVRLELLNLNGTDLILSECTFTILGESPVSLVTMQGASALGNRVLIQNCQFRGEKLTAIDLSNVPCDLYAQNSCFLSRSEPILRLSLSSAIKSQSLHFANCTLLTGLTGVHIAATAQPKTPGKLELTFSRSLVVGLPASSATGLRLVYAENSAEPVRVEKISLKLRHTRFINLSELTDARTAAGSLSVKTTEEWSQFWGTLLPSDDLLDLPEFHENQTIANTTSLQKINQLLGHVSRPGVGTRSLIGIEAEQIPEPSPSAIERELVMNQFRAPAIEVPTLLWSEIKVRFDLNQSKRLGDFLSSAACPDGSTVTCFGTGIRKLAPIVLQNRRLRLRFEQSDGTPLSLELDETSRGNPMFLVDGGALEIEQGSFQVPKSKSANHPLFLETRNGARLGLFQSQVIQPISATGTQSLIKLGPAPEQEWPTLVRIQNSFVTGSGPLLELDASRQSLQIENSILIAGLDLINVAGNPDPGRILIQNSTCCASQSIVNCLGSARPIETYVVNSVFGPPPLPTPAAVLLRGPSRETIRQTLNWWESSCGVASQIQTPLLTPEDSFTESYGTAWRNFWGVEHVSDPLYGPQAVVMTREIADINHPQPEDFEIHQESQSATWTSHGDAIGATASSVGPRTKPKSTTPANPQIKNTPAGF